MTCYSRYLRVFFAIGAAGWLIAGSTVPAQDDPAAEAPPSPSIYADVVTDAAPGSVQPASDAIYWRLKGGGEVVGRLVKETPREVFVDIGPSIIPIPLQDVLSRLPLSEMTGSDTESPIGLGAGVFDPETGSVVFRSRTDADGMLSRQEILENAKRGIVLVSNPAGLGTGWLIDEGGRLITNHHVVGNESYQTVTLFVKRGNQWERERIENCKVENFSTLYDIAVVQLDMKQVREKGLELYPLRIGAPGELESGDLVYAVGNPGMGRMVLEHTVSEGIVSSLARNFGDVLYLQTTAAVNPGNSGGPLINERGEVVGLVTLKAMFQEGVAFALPVDYIHQFLRYSNAYAVSDTNRNNGFRYLPPQ